VTAGQNRSDNLAMSGLPGYRRFSVAEYLRMAEAGILRPDERVELIDGQIVAMSPQGPVHSALVPRIARHLDRLFPSDRYCIRQQATLPLGEDDAPEPDLAVVAGRCEEHERAFPREVLLVAEVADSSVRLDRGRKSELYSAGGVPEYWLVDVPARLLEIRREPSGTGYKLIRVLQGDDTFLPAALEGTGVVPLKAADVLPLP